MKTESIVSIEQEMTARLGRVIEPVEIAIKAPLVAEINDLLAQGSVEIIKHNYMEPAFEMISGVKGDSLEASRRAARTDKDTIVFCGVVFMAETAKILSPQKKVLIPSMEAGCSLAGSINAEQVRNLKRAFPGLPVVTYVNSYADVKAETDVCCTSTNKNKVVEWVKKEWGTDKMIFIPDRYLAENTAKEMGMKMVVADGNYEVAEKNLDNTLITWDGRCEVHERFSVSDVRNIRAQFPEVRILAHPECREEVVSAADFSGSTTAMINFIERERATPAGRQTLFSTLTECSLGESLAATGANILRMCSYRCPHMAQITLENLKDSLVKNQYEINLPSELMDHARLSLERMIQIG